MLYEPILDPGLCISFPSPGSCPHESLFLTPKWLKAAAFCAVRIFAEAALAYIGTWAVVLGDVNWLGVLSAGAFGAVTALMLALAGLLEVKKN